MSFIFGGNTGINSAEELKARRDRINALVDNIGSPTTIGGGISAIGDALAAGILKRDLSGKEEEGRKKADASFNEFIGQKETTAIPTPVPTPNPTQFNDLKGTDNPVLRSLFDEAEKKNNLPPGYLYKTASLESTLNPNAQNPDSTAGGLFQFTDKTAKEYGLKNRFDPVESTEKAALLAANNRNALAKSLGRDPTPTELYAAHLQGATGASRMISRQNAPLGSMLSSDAISLNSGKADMPASEYMRNLQNKFSAVDGGRVQLPPGGTQSTAVATAQPAPVSAIDDRQNLQKLVQLASNPFLNSYQKLAIEAKIKQSLDPSFNLDMKKKELDIKTAEKALATKGSSDYGVISQDEFGNNKYGFIDKANQKIIPMQIQNQNQGQPQDPSTSQVAQPGSPVGMRPAPTGVDPKSWREAETKRLVGEMSPANNEFTASVRKEIQNLPSYKKYAESSPVYSSMLDASKRDTKGADLNMVYALAKIFDPTSVVREGEVKMASDMGSIQEYLNGVVRSMGGSGRLTPEVRQHLLDEGYSRMAAHRSVFDSDLSTYKGIAERQKMNPADILPVISDLQRPKGRESKEDLPRPASIEDVKKLPKGTKFIIPGPNQEIGIVP